MTSLSSIVSSRCYLVWAQGTSITKSQTLEQYVFAAKQGLICRTAGKENGQLMLSRQTPFRQEFLKTVRGEGCRLVISC